MNPSQAEAESVIQDQGPAASRAPERASTRDATAMSSAAGRPTPPDQTSAVGSEEPLGWASARGEAPRGAEALVTEHAPGSASGSTTAHVGLAVAVVSVSFSAIFIKLAASPPLTIATNRMLASLLLLALPTLVTGSRQLASLRRADLVALGVSGACLAAHFGLWTLSLAYTSVASSVVFVSTHPVFVLLLEWLWLRRPLARLAALGVVLTVVGSLVIGANDLQVGGAAGWGDLLALGGAVTMVGYLLIGRRLRQRLGFLSYSTPVYLVAWLGLLAWTTASGQDVRAFPASDLVWFVGLAVFATIGGHTVFNWALRHVPASVVAATLVGEPVCSAALAWLILGQAIGPLVAIGGAIILLGIYLAARGG
jgi:drug/metabolite transporter (DMT)-like permease